MNNSKNLSMDRGLSMLFQGIVVLLGIAALIFLLWEPHLEGVNANATTISEIYFDDPFLAFAYIASIPFFVGGYQALKLLGAAGESKLSSRSALNSLRTIKYCALATIAFVAVGEIFIVTNESDDRAGGVFMGLLITVGSIVVAVVASMFERKVRKV